jgi:hypothetical protein
MRSDEFVSENLKQWFKEKWVRFGPDGKIRGDCARGSESEGKPKCLPQSKAQALGKKGRASAAAKKRREDPNPERRGAAKNVATKVKEDDLDEACWKGYHKEGMKTMFGKRYPNCVKNTKEDIDEADRIARKAGQPANSRKHSDLYTDENPKGTITGLKFATVEDARASVSKIRSSGRSHAHKVQAAVAMEQRARAAGKASAAAVYRAYINSVKKTDESLESYVDQGVCPMCHGNMVAEDQINEKQDACYHKVKSRYKVWPSAYASGALVQCRKKGAANWGNKSKNESQENMMDELDRIVELSTGISASERAELAEEFDLIESNINMLAEHNGVDAEVIWEDLESLTDDELYVFAVTQPVMEDWQKANKKDRTAGMSQKAVNAYRRENPGSKLKTAVTTKPSKLKKGSKASKRRKSYCSRSRGQMKMHNISCAKTPDKAICAARRRWNCE